MSSHRREYPKILIWQGPILCEIDKEQNGVRQTTSTKTLEKYSQMRYNSQ